MSTPYVSNLNFAILGATYKAVRVSAFGREEWFPKSQVSISNGRVVAAAQWIFRQKFPNAIPPSDPFFKLNTQPIAQVKREINSDLTLGAYQLGDNVFVVRLTKKRTRFGREVPRTMYALQMVAINGERLMLDDSVQKVNFVYNNTSKDAIFDLSPDHKLPMIQQESITIRYGRCLICARGLVDATSVKDGIGPICYERMTGVKRSKRNKERAKAASELQFSPVSQATRESLQSASYQENNDALNAMKAHVNDPLEAFA